MCYLRVFILSDITDDQKWYREDSTEFSTILLFFAYDNSTGIVPTGTIRFIRELVVVVDFGTNSTTSFNPI